MGLLRKAQKSKEPESVPKGLLMKALAVSASRTAGVSDRSEHEKKNSSSQMNY